MLWCGGNLPILIQRVKMALINVKKNVDPSKRKVSTFKQGLKDLELTLLGICKLCVGTGIFVIITIEFKN